MIRRILVSVIVLACAAVAQVRGPEAQTVVVMPFENLSHAPGLEWIGEAFPEVIGQRLSASSLFVIGRDDRLYAFDRVGIPQNVRPSRVTLYEIAQEMDADYAVLGQFNYDGQTFSGIAQLLDVKQLKLMPRVIESGSLLNIMDIQNALAWDLLNQIRPGLAGAKSSFVSASAAPRLDAFENYIRGVTAQTRPEKIRRFRAAAQLNPQYSDAIFQLGKTYFAARDYDNAAQWLTKVPHTDQNAREANFYEGLSYYYLSQFDKADAAFSFVASKLPLTEVYNNLGVVASRRGRKNEVEYLLKAVDADPKDPDYRFNLAVALARAGDNAGAAKQLRECLVLRPNDSEAKGLLDEISGGARPANLPVERIKRNYDEASFRQLAFELENAAELKLGQTDPATHAKAHIEQGKQYLSQGFNVEAEKMFRESVMLDPANPAGHVGLATAFEAQGDLADARNEAATAIRLQPTVDAYLVLAKANLRDNKLQEASDAVEHALALEPGNAAAQALKRDIAARSAAAPTATPRP